MADSRKAHGQCAWVLGLRIDAFDVQGLLATVSSLARDGGRHRVMYANVHVLNTAVSDPELKRILNLADIVYCDGAGVRLAARLLGQILPERMTGADWIYPACERWQQEGLSVYFLAGAPGVAARAADLLHEAYPGLRIAGAHSGFFADSDEVIAAINATRPDLLLVGMGTPLQERWVAANSDGLRVPVIWTVGALLDFVSGTVPRAPRWMLDRDLEWLGRLFTAPRRLWKRYLVGNPVFLGRVALQRFGLRRYE